MLIDWHAHHTAPELLEKLATWGARPPRPDAYDSADFDRRASELDEADIGVQLICQGAGLDADRMPAEYAVEMMRSSNDVLARRIEPHGDRFFGTIAVSLQNPDESAREITRMAGNGFRAVFMYARGSLVTRPEAEPMLAALDEAGLPIFLHGGGGGATRDPSLQFLEDEGQGVVVSAHADAAVTDCVVRMIAAGIFDRHPGVQVVIRSGGGGVPLLLNKLYWKHKGPKGEQRYADVLREHFLVDTASVSARTLQFLVDTMGEDSVVFGSDYCGGLGPLTKGVRAIEEHPDSDGIVALTERNSRRLLGM
jgi:hypothetical protein